MTKYDQFSFDYPTAGDETRGLVLVLPLYGEANRLGEPEAKRVLSVAQFDCNSIRLPGPSDVTWRVMCAIVYMPADSTRTDSGHDVAFRRVAGVED